MLTHFSYAAALCERLPQLHSLVVFVEGVHDQATPDSTLDTHLEAARQRLAAYGTESALPAVQAWRVAYRATGTDPTKFRMAAESILRRLRTSGDFSRGLHPLVLLCNALSARFGVPVAALDCERISGALQVRTTADAVRYEAFDGTVSTLAAGEVSFVDEAGNAHARKWSHKQSALSAASPATRTAFVIAEALHAEAADEFNQLQQLLAEALALYWPAARVRCHRLSGSDLVAGVPFAAAPAAI
jgi:DNA/RNA-binding domain of Phe-tRNA-synthetase-like protein